ncbi:DUF6527 family protein [Paraburkholderia sp. WSM4177]|nr:DUF6527 family protein [Paraburkholderia sp. WSM4177]
MMNATNIRKWWRNALARIRPRRRLRVIEGDSLPSRLPRRDLILMRDDGEDWCVGMRCPCGCGHAIELLVVAEGRPRWDIEVDANGAPTLKPSVWMQRGCRSHFWVREGRIHWC